MRSLVVMANRNGFFYVLDRKTGESPAGAPLREADVGEGTRREGTPDPRFPTWSRRRKGTLVYPSLQGSTNWSSPSYSPATGMLYVPVREMGSVYYKSATEYRPGTYYTGGSEKRLDEESWGAVRAIDVQDRQAGVGLQAAVAAVGRRDGDRRRPRVRRIERRQLLRRWTRPAASRCGSSRPAARSAARRWRFFGRQTTRRRLRRPRAVRVWSGVKQLRTPPDTPVAP